MKKNMNFIKKNIKYYIFLTIWIIIYNSIDDNFPKGSNNRSTAYIIMWVVVMIYAIISAVKEVRRIKKM